MNTTEITIAIAIVTVICSIVGALLAVSNLFRASRKEATTEAKQDATCNTRLETELDYVAKGVDDIRLDNKDLGRQFNELNTVVARIDESTKSAQKRIDDIEDRREK